MLGFDKLRTFIDKKFQDGNLDKKVLAQTIGISQSIFDKVLNKRPYTVNKVIESRPPQITIKSILGISNHFNCSVDEMLGRDSFIPQTQGDFKKVSPDEAMSSLREFINGKLKKDDITIFELSKNCGFGKDTFSKFMKGINPNAVMSTPAVIAIADYFKVSLDEIIGRKAEILKERESEMTSSAPASAAPAFLAGLNKKDLEFIEGVRKESINQSEPKTIGKSPIPQISKPSRVK